MLVTFGIRPSEPNIGYGYIKAGHAIDGGFAVDRFVEKPDAETARGYLADGGYLWNSGIFLFPARQYLAELAERAPATVAGCRAALAEGARDLFFFRLGATAFGAIAGQSIDYAVMEHTAHAAVVQVEMGWSDIGSYSSLWQESARDEAGNAVIGDVIAIDTRDSYVRGEGRWWRPSAFGTWWWWPPTMRCWWPTGRCDQQVRQVVAALKRRDRPEATQGARTWRPWGWFHNVEEGSRYRVKHIMVNPGAKLSLQKHWHRSEHWVVVTGTAIVTRDGESFMLRENESVFIPAGTPHRLENPGKVPLRLIEVQSGEYVGEDDIVRLEDDYGRTR